MKAEQVVAQKGAVLIIDDHPEELDVLIASLQTCGLTILIAPQGEHAINLAEQFVPDIILLDVRMPGMEGFGIYRQLRRREVTREIPIIFIMTPSETLDNAKEFEVSGMVPKALNFHEAVEAYEKQLILTVLRQNHHNTAKSAEILDIPLRTLYRKIKRYRLLGRRTSSSVVKMVSCDTD